MTARSERHRLRPLLTLLAATAGWTVIVLLLARVTSSAATAASSGPVRPEDAVALLAGCCGLLLAAWLAVATLVSALAVLRPGSRLGRGCAAAAVRVAPAGLRRVVVLAVGVGLLAAAPAVAAPGHGARTATGPGAVAASVAPGLDPA
ncbi:MAG TPA: hypothetical protein VFP72_21665, partial [Kineosporiaceae bacterium]|nr:hypothetical protein [Kineosporiaceae bacterium]